MSHYLVMVLGDEPEENLEPFSEHLEMEEYLDSEVSDKEKEDFCQYYGSEISDFEESYKINGGTWNNNSWRKNEEGVWCEYSTYNPDSKWDWYVEGGRWGKPLKSTDGTNSTQLKKYEISNLEELVPYSLLTEEGEWLSRGEMGWWGVSIDDVGDETWEEKYLSIIRDLPDDTLITVFDCHI